MYYILFCNYVIARNWKTFRNHSIWGDMVPNNVQLYTTFESVACQLELAILSRKFGITEHGQSSVVEYFGFFQHSSPDLYFYKVMGITSKTSNLSRFFIFSE